MNRSWLGRHHTSRSRPGYGSLPDRLQEELEWDFYDQSSLNLAELIEEQVLISIPEKKLCSTSCKGLCQRCGVNLNTQSCLCNEEIEDHPFAVLKGIGSEFENFQK